MKKYHKIQTVFKRDPENKNKTLLEGQYSSPEFEYLKDNKWVFTEKVDGTNIRIMWDGEKVRFGGKTDRAQTPPFLLEELGSIFGQSKHIFAEKFEGVPVCLYSQSIVLFDVRIGEWGLQRQDVEDTAAAFAIDVVPIIGSGTLSEMVEWARSGINSRWGDFQADEYFYKNPFTNFVNEL